MPLKLDKQLLAIAACEQAVSPFKLVPAKQTTAQQMACMRVEPTTGYVQARHATVFFVSIPIQEQSCAILCQKRRSRDF